MKKHNWFTKGALMADVAALAASAMTMTVSAEGEAPVAAGGGMIGTLIPMVILFVLLYFVLIRPQKKKDQEQKAMQRAVRIGDEVVTIGGVVGLVTRVEDETVVLETGSDRHKIRFKIWAIQENITVKEDNERKKAAAVEEARKKKEKKNKKDADEGVLKD